MNEQPVTSVAPKFGSIRKSFYKKLAGIGKN